MHASPTDHAHPSSTRPTETALFATPPPDAYQLHSVVLAKSGTLLLTWADPHGSVTELRRRLRANFPGASSKQPVIVHSSLWRIVGPAGAPLGEAAVRALSDEAQRWTDKVCDWLLFRRLAGARSPSTASFNGHRRPCLRSLQYRISTQLR
jgi:hypothetical protein